INAARDLTITSAQDTLHNANQSNNKAIGKVVISDTERFSGYHNEKHKDNSDQVTQVASNVSSLKGDVNLSAGQKYTQASSNVLAGNDVNITAKTIDISALQNTGSHQESNSDLKIGTFARISSPLIDLVNNVEAARKSDDRLKAMQGMAAAANGYQAASAASAFLGGPGSGVLVKGEAGIGFASSSNSSNGNDSTAQGSTINGGRNVTLTATGGDIHATGATLNAGKTLSLDAAQNIVLDASQSTLHSDGKNKSSGVEAGVGFQVGAQTGVYVYAAANMGKGHNKSDSTVNNNTELKAETINISSKGDTTLKGATATANTINTDVGGKLAIESVQDTSEFDSKQTNTGVRVQVGFGVWSANGNLSQQNGKGTYAGVEQQSGLFAGDGGYHVKADTIDLKGGAIASTNAAASELTTNKLTTSNIENKMTYSASNVSMAGGVSGSSEFGAKNEDGSTKTWSEQKQLFGTSKGGNTTPGLPMLEKGSDSSTTYATITDGKITIGGVTTNSVKDLGINTDASKANTSLDKLPDLQKLLKDQQAMSAAAGTVIATTKQVASDIATEANKAEATAQKTLNNPNSTDEQRAEAERTIDAARQVQAEWGVGGDKSRALNVVTGILVGSVAGQGGAQIAANAAAPYAAAEIGAYFKKEGNENQTLQDLSHAVLGAVLAVANNSSAAGGALAGGGGELAAQVLTKELYPQAFDANGVLQRDKLTPEQASNISALSSAIGALMSGAAGGGILDAAVGSHVATNAVENNHLSRKQMDEKDKELALCAQRNHGKCSYTDATAINRKYLALSKENDEKVAELMREANRTPGKAQSIGEVEGFFTFNPVGKALKGLGSAGYGMTVGNLAGPGNLAMDVAGISKELIVGSKVDPMGIETPYIPKTDFLRSIVTKGALATAGHYASGMIDAAPGVSTIFAIYRKDPEQLGASAWSLVPVAAEAGVFTRGLGTGTRFVAGMAEDGAALPRSVTQLMGRNGSLLGEMADGKWVWSQAGAVTKVATTLDGQVTASSAIAKQVASSPTSSSSAIRAQTANQAAIGAIADTSNATLAGGGANDAVKSTTDHVGAGGAGFSPINTTARMDNCTACTTAHIINKIEGLGADDIMTANQVEATFGYTGKERAFTWQKSLSYVEDATEMKGHPAAFNSAEADPGHYVVFPRKRDSPYSHVMYGEVLPDGTRYLYDPQVGKTMSWSEMLKTYEAGAKTFNLKSGQ
ncbi:Haemagluttinin repeat-containing protein, partial [Duganella sp. CF458]|uniref:hemagglutinin repeat-containing protein n=1 Tax=Duganella sp. CF458 TaxID=1884368 RepID=UPI0008E2059E